MLHIVVLAMMLEMETSWEIGSAGIGAGAWPHPHLILESPSALFEGNRFRASCRTSFIAFPVLDSVSDGPASPEGQM